jgi:hypothetical protein
MTCHPLVKQLKEWGEDIAREYERASDKGGKKSPSDVAEFRESVVSAFVETFFPFPYRTTKGVIRDINGLESASTDVILLNPVHPHTWRNSSKASLILADGVEAAIEVKSDSQSKAEIDSALRQVAKTKSLKRLNHGLLSTAKIGGERLKGDLRESYEDYWREVPSFVFFEKASSDPEGSLPIISAALQKYPSSLWPDFIVINNGGIVVNERLGHVFGYDRPVLVFERWAELTVAGFLLFLNMIPPASVRMQSPFLKKYLEPLRSTLPKHELKFRSS